ncbi:hypothetical protein V2J09_000616 [Rumex salicifolius]
MGHPGSNALRHRSSQQHIFFYKFDLSICNVCQFSKQSRLPFVHSTSVSFSPFDLIHCDLWTSPILIKLLELFHLNTNPKLPLFSKISIHMLKLNSTSPSKAFNVIMGGI